MSRTLQLIAGVTIAALVSISGTGLARADTFNFSDFPGTAPSTANNDNLAVGNIDTFSSVNTTNNTVNTDGLSISATALQTTATSFSTHLNGTLSSAFLGDYTEGPTGQTNTPPAQNFGLGVSNTSEKAFYTAGGTTSPDHTVSNELVTINGVKQTQMTDVVAFLLPSGQIPISILLNQFCGNGSAGPSGCGSSGGGKSDVSLFIGTVSLTGKTLATALAGSNLSGFHQLTTSDVSSATNAGLNGSGTRTVDITNTNLTGNILIVTASLADLGSQTDFFKIGAVGTQSPTIHNVPEPGSIALFGVGLVGLVVVRRRYRHRAS